MPHRSPVTNSEGVMPKILVVDDEPDVLEVIGFNLKAAGFTVLTADDGATALKRARQEAPDLIVLDVMLPNVDGLEACRALRREAGTANIPIILLTARAAEVDRVLGLELGADDYVTKPFSPRELVLRIRKLLQRRAPAVDAPAEHLRCGDLEIDVPRHQVKWQGEILILTATEFRLLLTLVQRRGRVQSRETLLRDVWEYDSMIDTRTVDTHMRRLREKLGAAAQHLETIRGVGYRFGESNGE